MKPGHRWTRHVDRPAFRRALQERQVRIVPLEYAAGMTEQEIGKHVSDIVSTLYSEGRYFRVIVRAPELPLVIYEGGIDARHDAWKSRNI